MQYIDFYPKTFHAIPSQDNPAFGDDECLLIVAESNIGNARAVVLSIKPDPIESVTSVAAFWLYENAVAYCEVMSSADSLVGMEDSIRKIKGIVAEQAMDYGLWFVAKTAPEAYLQQELRKLHSAIDGA